MTKQFSFLAGLFVCGFGYLNFSIPGYAALKESANICSIPASIATIPKPKQEVLGAATNIFEPSSTPTLQPPASTIQTATPSAGLNADVLFGMINNYRKNSGLPEFQKDEKTCQLARKRAPELYNEIWVTHTMHTGMYGRHLPYWNTENIISMQTEEQAFNWWINESVHHSAIAGNYIYSCIACSGNECAQEFTNYQPK